MIGRAILSWGLVACTGTPSTEPEKDSDTATTDTAEDTAVPEIDDDGDNFPRWDTTSDASLADCDDADPAVSPATERFVPAGSFTRGQEDLDHSEPVRTITLSAYCIDVTEVENQAFAAFLRARGSNEDDDGQMLYDVEDDDDPYPERIKESGGAWQVDPGFEHHPVVEVWHYSAEFYCAQAGKRLPTEAEYERAARGDGDARRWPWGDEEATCEHANFVLTPTLDPGTPCVAETTPVGSYPLGASPHGALDLAGNVSEWVSDWFDPDAYATDSDTDPSGPEEGVLFDDGMGEYIARLTRGGNYLTEQRTMQAAFRVPEPEWATSNGIGFRCARTPS